jgi:hypothetical protein
MVLSWECSRPEREANRLRPSGSSLQMHLQTTVRLRGALPRHTDRYFFLHTRVKKNDILFPAKPIVYILSDIVSQCVSNFAGLLC